MAWVALSAELKSQWGKQSSDTGRGHVHRLPCPLALRAPAKLTLANRQTENCLLLGQPLQTENRGLETSKHKVVTSSVVHLSPLIIETSLNGIAGPECLKEPGFPCSCFSEQLQRFTSCCAWESRLWKKHWKNKKSC